MIGNCWGTSIGSVMYQFDPDDLAMCVQVARQRGALKAAAGIPHGSYIKQTIGTEDEGITAHLRGLRAEWAVCRLLGVVPPIDAGVSGDKHQPDIELPYGGPTLEVKYTHYNGECPKFVVDGTDVDLLQAHFGVLARRPPGRSADNDADELIDIYGVVSKEAWIEKSYLDDFGYGPRRVAGSEILIPFEYFMDDVYQFYERAKGYGQAG